MAYLIASADTARFSNTVSINSGATSNTAHFSGNDTEGLTATSSGNAATLSLSINSWGSVSNIKACLYNNSNALVETVVIPSSAGTGVVSVALSGSTAITSGDQYRLAIYTDSDNAITLNSDTGGLTLRLTTSAGDYTTPVDPLPAGSYVSFNEFYWAIEDAAASNSAPVVNDQTFSVADSASNGTVIGTLVATDSDGTVDSYAISGTTLAINSTTGQITLNDNSGIVAGTPITATATVTDDDGDTDTATVTVNVTSTVLSADSITAGTINVGDTVTIQLSNASVSGKTLNVNGVPVSDTAQDATSISFLAMDLFNFAGGIYRFDNDITITVVDGAESDTIAFQISPDTGYTQFAVPDPIAGVWASSEFTTAIDPQVLAIGDYIWCTNPTDSDAPNGSFPESSSIDYRIMDMSDGTPAWGSEGTITVTSETSGGFNSWKEWMESLPSGSFTTKLRVFLEGKGYSGSTSTMLYEYLKTVSSKASHQERKKDWEEGGWN